jgi:hypothetical protein
MRMDEDLVCLKIRVPDGPAPKELPDEGEES